MVNGVGSFTERCKLRGESRVAEKLVAGVAGVIVREGEGNA